ncbi:MAG: hypothetical protein HY974_03335 [Candidatus Kerfeldbacteria bacterium]|nr:hypothetical protein [Candidatus Kerfeldbacteria bacterium]
MGPARQMMDRFYSEPPDSGEWPEPVLPDELAAQQAAEVRLKQEKKQAALVATVKMNLELGLKPNKDILQYYGQDNYRRVEAELLQGSLFNQDQNQAA